MRCFLVIEFILFQAPYVQERRDSLQLCCLLFGLLLFVLSTILYILQMNRDLLPLVYLYLFLLCFVDIIGILSFQTLILFADKFL